MHIVVFGSTGRTGQAAIHELLEHGHTVTAFARRPDSLGIAHKRLTVVQGDVMDPEAVRRAMAGTDGVIVSLGVTASPLLAKLGRPTHTPANVCEAGTQHVISAMQQEGVRRLVCITAWGVGDSRTKVPWFFRLFLSLLLRERYRDKELQEAAVRRSGLDWTIVRPVGLGNGPATSDYFVSTDRIIRRPLISRADVAGFAVRLTTDGGYVTQTVALSG